MTVQTAMFYLDLARCIICLGITCGWCLKTLGAIDEGRQWWEGNQ